MFDKVIDAMELILRASISARVPTFSFLDSSHHAFNIELGYCADFITWLCHFDVFDLCCCGAVLVTIYGTFHRPTWLCRCDVIALCCCTKLARPSLAIDTQHRLASVAF